MRSVRGAVHAFASIAVLTAILYAWRMLQSTGCADLQTSAVLTAWAITWHCSLCCRCLRPAFALHHVLLCNTCYVLNIPQQHEVAMCQTCGGGCRAMPPSGSRRQGQQAVPAGLTGELVACTRPAQLHHELAEPRHTRRA